MKKTILLIAIICITTTYAQAQYQFSVEKSLTCTPIKNQQRTGTCWSFATTSFMESEYLRSGVSEVDISEMFLVRNIYVDKALNYLLRQGKANFSQGSLSHDVVRAINRFGAVPESAYSGLVDGEKIYDHSEMEVVLKSVLDGLLESKKLSVKWPALVNSVLDVYMGPAPTTFTYKGKKYSPRQYADELGLKMKDYISITSFSHHPFYEKFILEIPDNYSNGSYYNVPLNELTQIVDQALAKGYTVAWDGDVSEKGFSARNGIAVIPVEVGREDIFSAPGPEVVVTQKSRQDNFENFSTTDDHLMHISGSATDQNGTKYYIIKNSWGEVGEHQGFLYMSESYFKMKTIAIMVNQNTIPKDIATKLAP